MFTYNEKKNFMKATRNVHALYYRSASTYVFFTMAIKLFDELSPILSKKKLPMELNVPIQKYRSILQYPYG